jgi:hypothetical protein
LKFITLDSRSKSLTCLERSAIFCCSHIYLGMIKRHAQDIPCKVLFLDDIFIDLDIADRLPLLEILDSEFPDYRILIATLRGTRLELNSKTRYSQ